MPDQEPEDLAKLELQYAVDNDCYEGEVEECDQCGRKTCRELARVWTDTLVICHCDPAKDPWKDLCSNCGYEDCVCDNRNW